MKAGGIFFIGTSNWILRALHGLIQKCPSLHFAKMATWDEAKRTKTLAERGLDFANAERVFAGPTATFADSRKDYGEPRNITLGLLDGRHVVIVWTPRTDGRRIISMRKANAREIRALSSHLA